MKNIKNYIIKEPDFNGLFYSILLLMIFSCGSRHNKSEVDSTPDKPKVTSRPVSSTFVKNGRKNGVVIFVHGIYGHVRKTWENENSRAYFPQLIAEDTTFKNYDVFAHSYPSPTFGHSLNIEELASNLKSDFTNYNLYKYDKIIFVCHSMGGLITRAFLENFRDHEGLFSKVKLIYFYSTPSEGSQVATWAHYYSKNPQLSDMKADEGQGYLGNLVTRWLDSKSLTDLPSYGAYEVLPTKHVMVVNKLSALLLLNRSPDPLEFNHINMVKPENNEDKRFIVFRNAFKDENLDNLEKITLPISLPKNYKKLENVNTTNNNGYKDFLKNLIAQIDLSATFYKDYRNSDRDCNRLKKIYQNNITMLSYMSNRPNYVERSGSTILLKHLALWTTAYEQQYSTNISNEKTSCAVEYDGEPFPASIKLKLNGILRGL